MLPDQTDFQSTHLRGSPSVEEFFNYFLLQYNLVKLALFNPDVWVTLTSFGNEKIIFIAFGLVYMIHI